MPDSLSKASRSSSRRQISKSRLSQPLSDFSLPQNNQNYGKSIEKVMQELGIDLNLLSNLSGLEDNHQILKTQENRQSQGTINVDDFRQSATKQGDRQKIKQISKEREDSLKAEIKKRMVKSKLSLNQQIDPNSNDFKKTPIIKKRVLSGANNRKGINIKIRSQPKLPSASHSHNRSKTPFSVSSRKPIPQQIMQYIESRKQVQIIQYFQEYKHQFYTKSKALHNYIYSSSDPQKVKSMYLNESDSHFKNGLTTIMLKLYRSGVIVPQSYTNLKQQAVDEIQKWVIGWVHRKIMYGKMEEDQDNQSMVINGIVQEIQSFNRQINMEDTSF